MTQRARQAGFSLIEVLLAVATLTIGLLFVGGTFMLGVHYTTTSAEQTYGQLVSQQAFTTIQLYRVNLDTNDPNALMPGIMEDYNDVALRSVPEDSFVYAPNSQYRWKALVQRIGNSRTVRVTVLVCRWLGSDDLEIETIEATINEGQYIADSDNSVLSFTHRNFLVDEDNSRVFRMMHTGKNGRAQGETWELRPPLDLHAPDAALDPYTMNARIIQPPLSSGRSPCIGAYQMDMAF
ncbi:prepilin-type N-terminal cleavage/methylation domain-containing protein [Planctomycetota bacterium]